MSCRRRGIMKRLTTLCVLLALLVALPAWADTFTATATASRAADSDTDVCYAPCAVHWDAHTTTHDTLTGDDILFGLQYNWDFGDSGSGTWATTGESKNYEQGFIGAHVYEDPGTYSVLLTVLDPDGESDTWTDTVIVDDPNDLTTYCFSNDATFAGCPESCPSANCIETSDCATVAGSIDSNRRLLLERGNTFGPCNGQGTGAKSAVRIGAYGTGSRPKWTSNQNYSGLAISGSSSDIAIWGLEFDGDDDAYGSHGIPVQGGTDHLVWNNKVYGYDIKVYLSEPSTYLTNVVVAENELGTGEVEQHGYGVYGGVKDSAVIGNTFSNTLGGTADEDEHLLRLGYHRGTLMSQNDLKYGYERHATKLHDNEEAGSYYWVYRRNKHICEEAWCVGIGPQSDDWEKDERSWYGIVEDNYLYGEESDSPPLGFDTGIITWASHIAVRNNICDTTEVAWVRGTPPDDYGTNITCVTAARQRDNEPEASYVRVYGNTMYRGGSVPSGTQTNGASLDADNSYVKDQLLYVTGSGTENVYNTCSGTSTTCAGQNCSSSPFSATVFDGPEDFQLASDDSCALNNGTGVSNTLLAGFDGALVLPNDFPDIGAWQYHTGDTDGDRWPDLSDYCPSLASLDNLNSDTDTIGDACDNCVNYANPAVSAVSGRTTTGGQLDDDADGYGNQCDAKFTTGPVVTALDTIQYKTALLGSKLVTASTCGTSGTMPCDQFDLDGVGPAITALDTIRFKQLLGKSIGPKCATCPLTCSGDACP